MITRIPLKMVSDHMFAVVVGARKPIRTPDYRTIRIDSWQTAKGKEQVLNLVQLRRPAAMTKVALAYAEDAQKVAVSLVETLMDEFVFGFGDVEANAPYLVIDHARAGSAAKIAKWLRKNTQGEVMTIEGTSRTRVSFADENDFILARIAFS